MPWISKICWVKHFHPQRVNFIVFYNSKLIEVELSNDSLCKMNTNETELNMHGEGNAWKTWKKDFLTRQQEEQVKALWKH